MCRARYRLRHRRISRRVRPSAVRRIGPLMILTWHSSTRSYRNRDQAVGELTVMEPWFDGHGGGTVSSSVLVRPMAHP